MLRTISGDKDPRRAGARRWFPARRLHLIDIENLAGEPRPDLTQVRQAQRLYAACLAFGAMDQVEVASSHLTLLNAALGWPHAHYRVRSGPDGADLELLDVLRHENVANRFTHVAIGSGDHLFAEAAARLGAQGVWVTVISRRDHLSRRLHMAAREVIFLDAVAKAA
jgi:NYN domain